MAKNNMGIKYKRPKRERNKVDYTMTENDGFKKFFIVLASVLVFIGALYLGVLGLEKLGVFEEGYTKPSKGTTEIRNNKRYKRSYNCFKPINRRRSNIFIYSKSIRKI